MIPLINEPNSTIYTPKGANRRLSNRQEMDEIKLKKTRKLNFTYFLALFGLCVLMLIVGILYLTAFFYRFSFVQFSPTICAALFVSFGGTLLIVVLLNTWMVKNNRFQFVSLTPLMALAFFTTLLGIGIWGLAIGNDIRLADEVRRNIQDTMRFYVEGNRGNEPTRKMDWLQSRFMCCGAESSYDWRGNYLYGGGSALPYQNSNNYYNRQPNYYPNQQMNNQGYYGNNQANFNNPYMPRTPDSCCVRPFYNCGKQSNQMPGTGNFYSLNDEIYTQGCMSMYYPRWIRDVRFISAFCTGVAVFGLFLTVSYLFLYFFIRKQN